MQRVDQHIWGPYFETLIGSPDCEGKDPDGGDPPTGGTGEWEWTKGYQGNLNDCRNRTSERIERKLQEDECPKCSADHLKLVYDSIGDKELELLGAESKLQICVDDAEGEKGIKSIFSCVLRQALEILSIVSLALEVVDCSLEKIECYGDLSNKPGQLNLLIQADRFQSFLQLALLAFGGGLFGDAGSILVNTTAVPSLPQLERFSTAVVNGLSDTSAEGRSLSLLETDDLLAVVFEVPAEEDIRFFADTWNRSLALWDSGVLSSVDLPMGYSAGFFDLSVAN